MSDQLTATLRAIGANELRKALKRDPQRPESDDGALWVLQSIVAPIAEVIKPIIEDPLARRNTAAQEYSYNEYKSLTLLKTRRAKKRAA
jgi:hypothetical protein